MKNDEYDIKLDKLETDIVSMPAYKKIRMLMECFKLDSDTDYFKLDSDTDYFKYNIIIPNREYNELLELKRRLEGGFSEFVTPLMLKYEKHITDFYKRKKKFKTLMKVFSDEVYIEFWGEVHSYIKNKIKNIDHYQMEYIFVDGVFENSFTIIIIKETALERNSQFNFIELLEIDIYKIELELGLFYWNKNYIGYDDETDSCFIDIAKGKCRIKIPSQKEQIEPCLSLAKELIDWDFERRVKRVNL